MAKNNVSRSFNRPSILLTLLLAGLSARGTMRLVCAALALAFPSPINAQADFCRSPALARVADAVAREFTDHDFILLGSTHGGRKLQDFLICVVSQPAFLEWTPNVLVEFATAVHQETVDRYLIDLAPLSIDDLRPAWFDTDRPQLWATLPKVPEFYTAVRHINEGLDADQRLRVLGGNEPVRWSEVRTTDDLAPFPFKTNFAAHAIIEHLAPDAGSKSLVVYGEGHIHYKGGTLMSDLGSVLPERLFVIGAIVDATRSSRDAIGQLGNPDEPFFRIADDLDSIESVPEDLFYVQGGSIGEFVDGVVYLGPQPDGWRGVLHWLASSRASRPEWAVRGGSH